MFLEVIEENEVSSYLITHPHEEIQLHHGRIILNQIHDNWQMRTGEGLSAMNQEVIMNHLYPLYCNESSCLITALFVNDPEESYEAVRMDEKLTFSCEESADIAFSSPLLRSSELCIFSDGRIEGTNISLFSLNGHILVSGMQYEDGMCLTILNSKCYLHHQFVLIQKSNTVKIQKPCFKPEYAPRSIPCTRLAVRRFPYAFLPDPCIEVKVRNPRLSVHAAADESMLSAASSSAMCAASLISGMFMAYRSYMGGRSIVDIMPMLILPFTMVLSLVLLRPLSAHMMKKRKNRQLKEEEDRYLAYLHDLEKQIQEKKKRIIEAYEFVYPLTDQTAAQVERGSVVRIGTVKKNLITSMQVPDYYDCITDRLRKEVRVFQYNVTAAVPFPLLIDLSRYTHITIDGRMKENLMHALMIKLANGSDEVKIALDTSLKEKDEMLYCRSLFNEEGRRRIMQKGDVLQENCILFSKSSDDSLNAGCIVSFSDRMSGDLHISDNPDGTYTVYYLKEKKSLSFMMTDTADRLHTQKYLPDVLLSRNDFAGLYGKRQIEDLPLPACWYSSTPDFQLKAYIGRDEKGRLIDIDLNERGDGPHGLIAGMTGSGKSELILTMLLSLAVNYAPWHVQFVLIDFKGGGCAQSLCLRGKYLPHVTGVLNNLDVNEMDRALIALRSECTRREKLFQSMNEKSGRTIRNIYEYRAEQKRDESFEQMADLLIVIDEFAELKNVRPDFMADLISIARTGRSLGIHLILATQKPAGIVNEQIWANTNFKLCMKVGSRQDSLEVLHRDDASQLKQPGSFILLKNMETALRGTAAYSHSDSMADQIVCFDETLQPHYVKAGNRHQAEETVELIQNSYTGTPIKKMWCSPVLSVKWSDLKEHSDCVIGIVDAVHENRQYPFCLKDKSACFVTMDHDEKDNLLRTLCVTLTNVRRKVWIIDDLELSASRLIKENADQIHMLTSREKDEICLLYNQITQKKEPVSIIITDSSVFLENAAHIINIVHLLSHCQEYRLQVLIMAANTDAIPYKWRSLIPVKCALKGENSQDIAALMDRGGKFSVKKKEHGILNDRWNSTFTLIHTGEEELKEALHA